MYTVSIHRRYVPALLHELNTGGVINRYEIRFPVHPDDYVVVGVHPAAQGYLDQLIAKVRAVTEITPTQAMDRLDAWLDKAGLMLTEEGRVLKTRNCHANMGRTPKLSLAVLLVNTTDPLVR